MKLSSFAVFSLTFFGEIIGLTIYRTLGGTKDISTDSMITIAALVTILTAMNRLSQGTTDNDG